MPVQLAQEQMRLFPALSPLVLFLKLFLSQRNLHETFMGGMGSYVLVCAPWTCWRHRLCCFLHVRHPKRARLSARLSDRLLLNIGFILYYNKLQQKQTVTVISYVGVQSAKN